MRKFVELPNVYVDLLPNANQLDPSQKVKLYLDVENYTEIVKVLDENLKKLRRILYEIYRGSYVDELYRKEDVSKKAKDITDSYEIFNST